MMTDEELKGLEVSLAGIGVLCEVLGELIPEDRPDLTQKLIDYMNMSADIFGIPPHA